jgi:ribonuclease VapC
VTVALDASALLAYLLQEPGAEVVDGLLSDARMTSVNWAEVVQKSLSAGAEVHGMGEELQALGMEVEPFLAADGEKTGQLWLLTRQQGLSLGDRACRNCQDGVPRLMLDAMTSGAHHPAARR